MKTGKWPKAWTLSFVISGEKTKLITNNNNSITTDVQIAGNIHGEIQIFKYLSTIISDEGSKPEVLARITQSHSRIVKSKNSLEIWEKSALDMHKL